MRGLLRTLTAAVIVFGTWLLWAYQVYEGAPVDGMLFTLAIVIALAAASVTFGAGSLSRALDALATVRDVNEGLDTSAGEESAGEASNASDGGE